MYTIRTGEYVKCDYCGAVLYRSPWQLKLNKNHFCNQDCKKKFSKQPIKYEIVGDYAFFYLFDRDNNKYICYIDIEDVYLLDHKFFIVCNNNGALCIQDFKGYKLHRLITNCPKNMVVDHINHNTLDNRKANLRICTRGENNQNKSGPSKHSTTKIRNVYLKTDMNKYFVKIQVRGKSYFKGYFPKTAEGLELAKQTAKDLRKKLMPFATS